MLTQQERATVETALAEMLAQETDFRGFLSNLFTAAVAQPLLLQLPTTFTRAQDYATFVIDYCLDSRWSLAPSMLERVLSRFILIGAGNFDALRVRVQAKIDPNAGIYMSRWIQSQQPFFARPDLRRLAQQLVESHHRPVLCVNGPGGSGRAYTRRFFEYLTDQASSNLHLVYHEVAPKTGPSTAAEDIASELTASMDNADGPPGRAGSSYASALSRYVLRNAMKQKGKWIFVLRGIYQEQMNPEVVEFVQLVAKTIGTGEYRKKLRLVLIDHPQPVPPLLKADVMEEVIPQPNVVGTGDIVDCLVQYNELRKSAGRQPIDASGLTALAAGILLGAPPAGKARLQYIYDELFKLNDMP